MLYLILVLVFFITLAFFYVQSKRALSKSVVNGSSIIFCGTIGSGKTSLLSRVVSDGEIDHGMRTQTSQQENTHPWKNDDFKLVDIPGHSRVRFHCLNKFLTTTRALLFLIDTENVRDDIRDSAEYLVSIMADPVLYSRTSEKYKLPILIVCNKQDFAMAKSPTAIQKMLEQEIDTLKMAHKQTLKSTAVLDNDEDEQDQKKKNIEKIFFQKSSFKFEDLKNFEVQFTPVSCVQENDAYSFENVKSWLENITKLSS